ncbi:MAG: ABC transporter permease [Candidatus Cloacimonetes bacterium]|jgi:putative ABC transport system permease protein|nr:ABC transporter permease [Candidatus Cloacimonadota bacterium]MDY0337853.1 ABC transporter permease [Candidatus Cloacimonadaceae bacterium]MCB5268864.1 ABC transporter permease [Candidatus Cloacimonadota bacterium]MCK9334374.1 ABC transporter permease [Candidatus Cloacimonadota bacterium]MDD2544269.1 ABC transporter permease [Candidatus Cloacimonadota bacterium]
MAVSLAESLHIGVADIAMRKVRSLVTVLGIVLGVMCIMVVLAIVAGMNESTLNWMQERGGLSKVEIGYNWQYDFRKGGDPSFTLAELRKLQSLIPEARAFNPTISSWRSKTRYRDKYYNAGCFGVFPDMQIVENWYPDRGRFINELDVRENNNVVVLGSAVAEHFFGKRSPLGHSIMINDQMMQIIGVMSFKYWKSENQMWGENALDYLNHRMYIPLSTMLNKISPGTKIDQVEIIAENPDAAVALKKKLEPIVLQLKDGKRVFRVSSAQEQMDQMKQSSMIFGAIFVMIAAISLLVGGIVIMNIMLASIKERTREIGVRLAIGARRRDIFVQFMVQTVLITALGGVFGIGLGYAILDVVGGYLEMPMVARFDMIFVALAVSVGIGLIFGIAPAVKASNLDPVIALREE